MPWVRKFFKGKQKVWVFVDEEGALVLQDSGLASIRYQNKDEAKLYSAHPRNIGADVGGGASSSGSSRKKSASSSSKSGGKLKGKDINIKLEDAVGGRVESDEVPAELASLDPPEEGVIEIYTDGACQGNPGPCSYGLLIREGEAYHEISQYLGVGTNNIGELMAILVALRAVPEEDRHRPVRLHTDSNYSIGVLTKGWKAKANVALINEIKAEIRGFDDLKFIKVKGHAGLPLNERADTLAVDAIDDYKRANP